MNKSILPTCLVLLACFILLFYFSLVEKTHPRVQKGQLQENDEPRIAKQIVLPAWKNYGSNQVFLKSIYY
jgi:hypothetical protein